MAKILVADDQRDLAELWKEALESAGHTVSVAHTGVQAVSRLEKDGDFELLITDVNMPDGGGIYATSEARAANKKIPVIAVSGNPGILSSGTLARLPRLGADQVLTKPVDLETLVNSAELAIKQGPQFRLMDLFESLFASNEK